MKTNIVVAEQVPGIPEVPGTIKVLAMEAASSIAKLMAYYGVMSLDTTYDHVGMTVVTGVSFKPMAGTLPGALSRTRNRFVRWAGDGLQMFGVISISLEPTPDELATLQKTWDDMQSRETIVGKPTGTELLEPKRPPTVEPKAPHGT